MFFKYTLNTFCCGGMVWCRFAPMLFQTFLNKANKIHYVFDCVPWAALAFWGVKTNMYVYIYIYSKVWSRF